MKILLGDVGGQLCAFCWGARVELHRLGLPSNYFDMQIVGSGESFNAAHDIAEQYDSGTRMWLEWLPSGFWKRFCNDMEHLEYGLRKAHPLDCSSFSGHPTKVLVALVNRSSLKLQLVPLNSSPDPIKLLLACCAQPILTGPREYCGQQWYDAGLVQHPLMSFVDVVARQEIWFLTPTPKGERLSGLSKWLCLLTRDHQARKLLWNYPKLRNEAMEEIESRPQIRVIQPKTRLPIGWRSNDKEGIKITFDLGIQAAQDFARASRW